MGRILRYKHFFLLLILIISILVSTGIGPVDVSPSEVLTILNQKIFQIPAETGNTGLIVWELRLPRILLAALVGTGLSICGVILQTVIKNPLADPHILGVSSGASVGAVTVAISGIFGPIGFLVMSVASFIGGVLAFSIVYVVARQNGKISPLRIVLAGVAVSYICSAVASYIIVSAKDAESVQSIQFWLLGSLSGAQWEQLVIPSVVVMVALVALLLLSKTMDALLLQDETVVTLGLDPDHLRQGLIALAALIIGVLVALSGAIGFVGLVIPHAVRIVSGPNHRTLIPLSALVGAIFLIWVDNFARIAVVPEELPIGVVTSLIGGPFFIWLLKSKRIV